MLAKEQNGQKSRKGKNEIRLQFLKHRNGLKNYSTHLMNSGQVH